MDFLLLFLIGVGTGLSGAMIPGPLFLFTVSESLKKDAFVGLRIALGHILIEVVFVVLIFLGVQKFYHIGSRHPDRSHCRRICPYGNGFEAVAGYFGHEFDISEWD